LKPPPTKAIWASGAVASKSGLNICAKQRASNFAFDYTFQRPNVPGRDMDVAVAMQIESNAAAARPADDASVVQALGAINAQNAAKQPTTCSSQRVGNTVQTVCK